MTKANLNTFMLENDHMDFIIPVLNSGGIILYPTDTIWGIGCDATNEEAIEKIFKLKNRSKDKPLVLLADSLEMVKKYVREVHPRLDTLLGHHKRPLTVVYDEARNLPANLVAANGSIAIRIVSDPFCKRLISHLGRPITSTSANISGQPFPGNFGEISSEIIQNVDFVVKIRQNDKKSGAPSVVVKVNKDGDFIFLRK